MLDLLFGSIANDDEAIDSKNNFGRLFGVCDPVFVGIAMPKAHYASLGEKANPRHFHLLRMIYEERIEGINFVLVIIFLILGAFAWLLFLRF